MSNTRLGQLMREARTSRSWTCRRAAELVGLSPEHYSNIEHGRAFPRYTMVKKYAQAFDADQVVWLEAFYQGISDRMNLGVKVTLTPLESA